MAAKPVVETVIKYAAITTGEGPHWEESTGKLLYVDIHANNVFRYDFETQTEERFKLENDATFIIPSEAGGYVVSSGRKICHLDWETKKVTDIVEVDAVGSCDRFNDAKCDRSGRLWAGTMGAEAKPAVPEPEKGRLYTLDKGNIRTAFGPVDLSNGLAWSSDNTVMYFVDSVPRLVYAFDYDAAAGTIANKRVAVDFTQWTLEESGYPDGMCIDQEGNLWVAGYISSKVMQFDPVTGSRLRSVTLPCKRVTSCCFGGKDYSEMYVTSSRTGLTDEEMRQQDPLAGSVFKITGLGAKGSPAPNYSP